MKGGKIMSKKFDITKIKNCDEYCKKIQLWTKKKIFCIIYMKM